MTQRPEPDFADQLGEIPDPAPAGSASIPSMPSLPLASTRGEVRKRRLLALLASGAWLAIHLAVYGVRRDFSELPASYVAAQILLPFLFGSASLGIALGRGRLGLGLGMGLVSALAVLGPAAFWVLALGTPVPHGGATLAGSWVGTTLCFDLTVAWAAVPLLLAAVVLRGAFAAAARWRSALLGAAIGLFVGGAINLHCPNVAPIHVLLGHGLAVLLAALAGAFALAYRTRA